jgi:hypothetical protein
MAYRTKAMRALRGLAGVSPEGVKRVRIVRQPPTEYVCVPGNIQAGEDTRVPDITQDDYGLPLSGTDWWMFDVVPGPPRGFAGPLVTWLVTPPPGNAKDPR